MSSEHGSTAFKPLELINRKFVNSVIFSAPFTPSKAYLTNFPYVRVFGVHTSFEFDTEFLDIFHETDSSDVPHGSLYTHKRSKADCENIIQGVPDVVYHGPTSFIPLTYDPYSGAKALGIYREIGNHDFQTINAGEIVQRILRSREMYEDRQRAKGQKAATEEAVHRREKLERQDAE